MAQTNINIRMEENLKQQFDHLCNELGLNMTTAITIFAKTMVRQQKIPFEIAIDPFYSEPNMRAINESIEQLKQGKIVTKSIQELEAMANE